jgi:SWIM zinc finger
MVLRTKRSVPVMLRFEELERNPISITLRGKYGAAQRDKRGEVVRVVAERLRKGAVKLTCTCPEYAQAHWCRHCLTVFADPDVFTDAAHREAFQKIVKGTLLEATADKLTKALEVFSVAYGEMRTFLPTAIETEQLAAFSAYAGDASRHADGLVEAIADFVKRASADISIRDSDTNRVGANFPELKTAFAKIRKSLAGLTTEPLLNPKRH